MFCDRLGGSQTANNVQPTLFAHEMNVPYKLPQIPDRVERSLYYWSAFDEEIPN